MNNKQKTPGQILYESQDHSIYLSPGVKLDVPLPGWTGISQGYRDQCEKSAQAVLSHALGGAAYVLLPDDAFHQKGDEVFRQGYGWQEVHDEWFGHVVGSNGVYRRPISLPKDAAVPAETNEKWEPRFAVGDEVTIRNPHHDWDNGMKKIGKVLVDRARYVLADDSHETTWPESALKPFTWPGV